jgi:hypothetical protein
MAVAVVALVAGGVIFWRLTRVSSEFTKPPDLLEKLQPTPPPGPHYKAIMQTDSQPGAGAVSRVLLEAPDGVRVTRQTQRFESDASVQAALEALTRDARVIVERGARCGDKQAERIVLLTAAKPGESEWAVIAWRQGLAIESIWGRTLERSLDLERDMFPCENRRSGP